MQLTRESETSIVSSPLLFGCGPDFDGQAKCDHVFEDRSSTRPPEAPDCEMWFQVCSKCNAASRVRITGPAASLDKIGVA